MRQIEYINEAGRKFLVELPDDAPDEDALMGVFIGPPDIVDELGYGEPFATRMHNLLYERGVWDNRVVSATPGILRSTIQNILRNETHRLRQAYKDYEINGG